jgi:hypothetical protein
MARDYMARRKKERSSFLKKRSKKLLLDARPLNQPFPRKRGEGFLLPGNIPIRQ